MFKRRLRENKMFNKNVGVVILQPKSRHCQSGLISEIWIKQEIL